MILDTQQVGWSVEGLQRMVRHGQQHLPSLFHIQLEQYQAAGAECLQEVYTLLSTLTNASVYSVLLSVPP